MRLISILFAVAGMAGCDFNGSVDPNFDCTSGCDDDRDDCSRECETTCSEDDEDTTTCIEDCDRTCDDDYDDCSVSCD